ncbi:hypothetical protein [Desulfonatronovibrio magnus]|uniref:hypothetical protein n=1 Tax=Desulfonatronovibrio magnus TaxID=698827 RepID=UPI0005EB17F8|nr:hypothetical protein [Desulfonatronovibrio magnus]
MKYIIFEDFAGEATPIIFPERVSFLEMREQIPYTKVLSAGIVSLDKGQIRCSGQSKELKMSASSNDSKTIAEYLNSQ